MESSNLQQVCEFCYKNVGDTKAKEVFNCEVCSLSSHKRCLEKEVKNNYLDSKEGDCIHCHRKSLETLDKDQLNVYLHYCIQATQEKIGVKFPFIDELEQMAKAKKFESTEDLLVVVKQRFCNFMAKTKRNRSDEANEETFKAVIGNVVTEVDDLQCCVDCFKNRYTSRHGWFAFTCEKPHLLVYAKLMKFPFWPSKVLRRSGETLFLRFFGDHTFGFVPQSMCFLLSEDYPAKEPKNAKFAEAKDELDYHVSKIKCKFPLKFKYASPKQRVTSETSLFLFENEEFNTGIKLFGDNEDETVEDGDDDDDDSDDDEDEEDEEYDATEPQAQTAKESPNKENENHAVPSIEKPEIFLFRSVGEAYGKIGKDKMSPTVVLKRNELLDDLMKQRAKKTEQERQRSFHATLAKCRRFNESVEKL